MASVLQLVALALLCVGVFLTFGLGPSLITAAVALFAVGFVLERDAIHAPTVES